MLIWHERKKQITWKFYTTQKMKFFIKDLVTLTEEPLTKNCIFCARLVLKEVRINDKGNERVDNYQYSCSRKKLLRDLFITPRNVN